MFTNGTPVPFGRVRAVDAGDQHLRASTTLDEEGRFDLGPLEAGLYDVELERWSHQPSARKVDVLAPSSGVVLRVDGREAALEWPESTRPSQLFQSVVRVEAIDPEDQSYRYFESVVQFDDGIGWIRLWGDRDFRFAVRAKDGTPLVARVPASESPGVVRVPLEVIDEPRGTLRLIAVDPPVGLYLVNVVVTSVDRAEAAGAGWFERQEVRGFGKTDAVQAFPEMDDVPVNAGVLQPTQSIETRRSPSSAGGAVSMTLVPGRYRLVPMHGRLYHAVPAIPSVEIRPGERVDVSVRIRRSGKLHVDIGDAEPPELESLERHSGLWTKLTRIPWLRDDLVEELMALQVENAVPAPTGHARVRLRGPGWFTVEEDIVIPVDRTVIWAPELRRRE